MLLNLPFRIGGTDVFHVDCGVTGTLGQIKLAFRSIGKRIDGGFDRRNGIGLVFTAVQNEAVFHG